MVLKIIKCLTEKWAVNYIFSFEAILYLNEIYIYIYIHAQM